MTFKSIEVAGSKDFMKIYNKLAESSKRKTKIDEFTRDLKQDVNKGDYIKRKPYPDKYRITHDVRNLYCFDIGLTHRMIYTIRTTKDKKKIYQFLDLLTHKEYDVLFGYSTS